MEPGGRSVFKVVSDLLRLDPVGLPFTQLSDVIPLLLLFSAAHYNISVNFCAVLVDLVNLQLKTGEWGSRGGQDLLTWIKRRETFLAALAFKLTTEKS